MARRSTRSRSASARSRSTISQPPASPPPPPGATTEPPGEFTGRYLVLLRDDGVSEGLQALKSSAGLTEVCNSADFSAGEVEMSQAGDAEVFVLDKLKVAVVRADPSQAQSLTAAAAEDSAILAVEPERIMYALQQLQPELAEQPAAGPLPLHYLRGYRDAVNHLYDALTGAGPELAELGIAAAFSDNAQFTWGLQATKVNQSRFTSYPG